MEEVEFDEPVVIKLDRVRRVTIATQAGDYLLNHWPTKGGAKHRAAREALIGALSGLKQARDARVAFAEAAKEAKILVAKPPARDAMKEIGDIVQAPEAYASVNES